MRRPPCAELNRLRATVGAMIRAAVEPSARDGPLTGLSGSPAPTAEAGAGSAIVTTRTNVVTNGGEQRKGLTGHTA